MAEGSDQEKTEKATPKKRQEARKKGQVAKSREIPSVLVLLSALSVFYFAGSWMFTRLIEIMRMVYQQISYFQMGVESTHTLLWQLFMKIVVVMAPLVLTVLVAGLLGNIVQTGFLVSGETMAPKFSKMDPLKGIKRLFSISSLVELVKSILKVAIIGGISYVMLRGEMDKMPSLIELELPAILSFFGSAALKLGFYTCLVLIILAVLDLAFQIWKYEKDLRMTKQEVKDEFKQREGDPKIRSRIRAAQREMAMQRMMQAVPDATVVITNPTHLAIALKFERDMSAPIVVAKGADHVAARIRAVATEHDVPIIEQKPLARAMYKDVEIGQQIPVELYQAVAEVLAYVYRLKGLASTA